MRGTFIYKIMHEERWQKIEKIFAQAVALPLTSRKKFVEDLCSGDVEICQEILELLREDEENAVFLSEPVFTKVLKIINNDFTRLIGKTFNSRYKLLEFIGRGGMGAVFLADDSQLKRRSALKIIETSAFGQTENHPAFRTRSDCRFKNFSSEHRTHLRIRSGRKFLFYRNGICRRQNPARADRRKIR